MSGGFFRGTSADQDTRFSNKQAKLLKSQKFAPELDHLVDISKVKMDVVKPWIAHRVTEFLGFEDEVLINFIYGLLEGKDINGKQVQIQITGFMEKNTGKFMKELWSLLLSAQSNASGVPQQFLDAKEEEIRKKKAESDRITLEIQKKKELEQEKSKKMDGEVDVSSDVDDVSNRSAKHLLQRDSTAQLEEEQKQFDERNGLRGRSRISRSPHSMKRSPSAERILRSRSISKSLSNSRSYSGGRPKSRSISRFPQSRGRSISPERRYPSPCKRSTSPRSKHSPRRARSPMRRRSPHLRRRSSSESWERSPSPRQHRSPIPMRRRLSPRRRRSPSPVQRRSPSLRRRRSPSPLRRRSPPSRRLRSPSPVRRRSPSVVRRRSPSPMRRRSPLSMRRRSPLHRRSPSPVRRRSPAPPRRRSPSLPWRSPSPPPRRSPSPVRRRSPPRSPKQRRSPFRFPRPRHRSGSPYRSHSPVYRSRRSWSRDHDIVGNGGGSKGYRDTNASQRTHRDRSPVRQAQERDRSGQGWRGPDSIARQPPITLRSPQRDPRDRTDARREVPLSLPLEKRSPSRSESSPFTGKSSPNDDRSLSGSPIRRTLDRAAHADSASPLRQPRDKVIPQESPETDRDEGTRHARGDGGQRNDSPRRIVRRSPRAGSHRNFPIKEPHDEEYFPEVGGRRSSESQRREDKRETSRNDRHKKSHRPVTPQQSPQITDELEFERGRIEGARFSPDYVSDEQPSVKQRTSPSSRGPHKSHSKEHYEIDERKRSHSQNALDSGLNQNTESAHKTMKKGESNNKTAYHDSDSVENDKNKSGDVEIRKNKRSERRGIASDDSDSYDSHTDERKLAKRRKKEEKRLRKEEKRRRRHEKHRRREERRASKHKAKSMDTVTPPSDLDKNHSDADYSDGQVASKRNSHPSDTEEPESEQKRLEIELREKALESLRAKKAINP